MQNSDVISRVRHWLLDASGVGRDHQAQVALSELILQRDLAGAMERLFSGHIVNPSEQRPALHMALRAASAFPGLDAASAQRTLDQREGFLRLAGRLHDGSSGLTDLIHVGIGGSQLGPRLVADALDADDAAVRVHWLSTLDGRRFDRLCRQLNPARTGMLIASRSFTTEEPMLLAAALRDWLGEDWAERSWAATAHPAAAQAFGLKPDHVLPFAEWVGGRFSLWSSVGISAAARIGPARFEQLLAGAEQADEEYRSGLDHGSMAIELAGLIHHLRRDRLLPTLGVISYEPRLALLADHLAQLFMESLGKHVDLDGQPVTAPTAPLIFGGSGTDLQHSIFQALHQGSDAHPLLLIGTAEDDHSQPGWQRCQLAHMQAQARALAAGRRSGDSHQQLPGGRPAMTLQARRLDAQALGWLLATFEHVVYTLSVLWHINPFDQWGVEESKRLAADIRQRMEC